MRDYNATHSTGDSMRVSIVIPTYNRVDDLSACLKSIGCQTTLPKEVIIVDDSDTVAVQHFIESLRDEFQKIGVSLEHIRNTAGKSLTIARNVGIKYAKGDIILFLDDDVVLDERYIKEILAIYSCFPSAMGVQGLITNIQKPNNIVSLFNRLFYLGHNEVLQSRVLPSASCTYPSIPDGYQLSVPCEWLSGCNQSYRKDVFLSLQFDENLTRYSYKEDVDFSYRVFKTWPLSLYMAPAAQCVHNVSSAGRLPKKVRIEMEEVYSLYFFYKNIDQNILNKCIYIWSRAGYFIKNIGIVFLKIREHQLLYIKYIIGAVSLGFRNRNRIKNSDLEFLDAPTSNKIS
jgi:GT2 family glycosyltransferase